MPLPAGVVEIFECPLALSNALKAVYVTHLQPTPLTRSMAVPCAPMHVPSPQLIKLNEPLAEHLGFSNEWLRSPEGVALLTGQAHTPAQHPVAQVYAGHQFGTFVSRLGDGRAHLIGTVTDRAGSTWDIQLKGSGRTPFSRNGDGRAALGPVLREYIVSEAMHALGVPTTRALAAS